MPLARVRDATPEADVSRARTRGSFSNRSVSGVPV